jgi:hypothetical protein
VPPGAERRTSPLSKRGRGQLVSSSYLHIADELVCFQLNYSLKLWLSRAHTRYLLTIVRLQSRSSWWSDNSEPARQDGNLSAVLRCGENLLNSDSREPKLKACRKIGEPKADSFRNLRSRAACISSGLTCARVIMTARLHLKRQKIFGKGKFIR